jgi:hypothetical protein
VLDIGGCADPLDNLRYRAYEPAKTEEVDMRSSRLPFVVTVVLVPLIGGAAASAQPQGRIIGIVRDATGAGIQGVTVTATNQATGDSHTASTTSSCPTSLDDLAEGQDLAELAIAQPSGMCHAPEMDGGTTMPQKKHTIATEDRRKSGQSVPLGDTGEGDTGVPDDEQGISNRPGRLQIPMISNCRLPNAGVFLFGRRRAASYFSLLEA